MILESNNVRRRPAAGPRDLEVARARLGRGARTSWSPSTTPIADHLAREWRLADAGRRSCSTASRAGRRRRRGPDLIRAATGIPPERRIVLFLGRLGRERGLEEAAEAVLRLARRRAGAARLRRLGGPAPRAATRDPRFAGHHYTLPPVHPDDVPAWTASADASVIAVPANSLNQRLSTPNKFWESHHGRHAGRRRPRPGGHARDHRAGGARRGGRRRRSRTTWRAALRSVLEAPEAERAAMRERCLARDPDRATAGRWPSSRTSRSSGDWRPEMTPLHVLTVSRWYPSHDVRFRGAFVADLVAALHRIGVDATLPPGSRRSCARAVRASLRSRRRLRRGPRPSARRTPYTRRAAGAAACRWRACPRWTTRRTRAGRTASEPTRRCWSRSSTRSRGAGRSTWSTPTPACRTGSWPPRIADRLGVPLVVTEHASDAARSDRRRSRRWPRPTGGSSRATAGSWRSAAPAARGSRLPWASTSSGSASSATSWTRARSRAAGAGARDPDELLFVGERSDKKGTDVLLAAMARLAADHPSLRLRLIGRSPDARDRGALDGAGGGARRSPTA